MDINVVRGIITAISLIAFLALVWWAWSKRQRRRFEDASMLPFDEPGERDLVERNLAKDRDDARSSAASDSSRNHAH